MSGRPREKVSPKTLADVSHLFFSDSDASPTPAETPPTAPDRKTLLELAVHAAGSLYPGTMPVEGVVPPVCASDLVLGGPDGRPVFLFALKDDPRLMPFLVLAQLSLLETHQGLFLKAFAGAGVATTERPRFLFVAPAVSAEEARAVNGIPGAEARCFKAARARLENAAGWILKEMMMGEDSARGSAVLFMKDG